eukprot:gene12598-6418_t
MENKQLCKTSTETKRWNEGNFLAKERDMMNLKTTEEKEINSQIQMTTTIQDDSIPILLFIVGLSILIIPSKITSWTFYLIPLIQAKFSNKKVGVEEIQDIIIKCLFDGDLFEYGTHYVIYRDERKKIRDLINQQKSKVQSEVNSIIKAYKTLDDTPKDTSTITIYDIFSKLKENEEQLNLDSPLKANISLAHFIGDYIKKNQDGQSRKVYSFNLNLKDINDKNALQRVIFLVENETIIHSMIVEEYFDIKLAYIAFLDSHEERDKSKGPGAEALVRGYVDFLALLCPDWILHIWVDPNDSSARKISDRWYLINQGQQINSKFRAKEISQEKLKARVYCWYEKVLQKENISRYSYHIDVPDLLSYGLKENQDKSLKGQDKIVNEWKALKYKVQTFRDKFQNEFKNTIVIELSKFSLASKEHFVLHEHRNDYFYDKPFDRENFLEYVFTKEDHQKTSKIALKFLTKEYCNSFELFDCGEVIDESLDKEFIEKNLKKKGSTITEKSPKKKK